MQEFNFSPTGTNNEPRSERPSDATTPKIIDKILRLVTDDRKLKVRKISQMINILTERVHNIFLLPAKVGKSFSIQFVHVQA